MANLEGTAVLMADGSLRPIEHIRKGDILQNFRPLFFPDDEQESLEWSKDRLHYEENTCIATNNTELSAHMLVVYNEGLLTSTADHYHFIKRDGVCQFKKALEVNRGDQFLSRKGEFIPIEQIEVKFGEFKVYKLDVESTDLYFANNILTHNAK
jgi:intein/homing endonuclease